MICRRVQKNDLVPKVYSTEYFTEGVLYCLWVIFSRLTREICMGKNTHGLSIMLLTTSSIH